MKTKNLDRVLKNHFPYCKMHEFSLLEDRHCSCGVEGAREELETIGKTLESVRFELENLFVDLCGLLGLEYETVGVQEILDKVKSMKKDLEDVETR